MIVCVAERSRRFRRDELVHWAFMAAVVCFLLWAADETYEYVIAVSLALFGAVAQTLWWRLARRQDARPRSPADSA